MNRDRAKELLPVIEHFANGGYIEFKYKSAPTDEWNQTAHPYWSSNIEYRIAVTPDTHMFEYWPDWANYAARNHDNRVWVYEHDPSLEEGEHNWGFYIDSRFMEITGLKIYTQGTCDWKDSKVKRPEGV